MLDPSFIIVKDSLLNEICTLNHLTFLRIGTEVKSLPSSFSNLWNLETLWVKNEGSTLVLLPNICDLVKLRVLNVTGCSFFDMDTDEPILIAEDSKLENLRELGKLVLPYSKETEDIFKRFPNLQELSFILKESWDYLIERYWFRKLDFLSKLDFLRVEFESSNTKESGPSVATNWSWDFHFPSYFKTLLLYDFPLSYDSLSTIARLPNLEELFLMRTIIQGEEWNIGEEDTFENLKYLCFEEWDLGEESFPVLEKLALWECHKLEEIPPSFGNISSLKFIELYKSPQLEHSALKIKQYVDDMTGGDTLKVEISRAPTEQVLLHYDSFSGNCRSAKRCPHRTRSLMKVSIELFVNEPFLAALSSSFILSSPPAAMSCTVTFLPPKAGDFNCKFLIETYMELPTDCYWKRRKGMDEDEQTVARNYSRAARIYHHRQLPRASKKNPLSILCQAYVKKGMDEDEQTVARNYSRAAWIYHHRQLPRASKKNPLSVLRQAYVK
ncbi:hypothetical protein T459_15791 [Capsicum annuum]|uniref:Disease resistance R13L4/SHOC-2-like LRR domain-containing protein n=1 Tax=Capsicum annuum TaxID=4072 RepID=A0A2G2Z6Z0_CAPAN|nr:hypothetical protein T459_15791 [Capsicum annuum]